MRPSLWHPPVELTEAEQAIVKRIRRAKLFVFLRRMRHELLSDGFQAELAELYNDSQFGQPPVSPGLLALVTIIQAYTGASDDEAVEATAMDRRWQLVLDCLDCESAPFGKATLNRFRQRLIEKGLDRRLIERTVEMAEQDGGLGPRQLRAALDSSPLWGGGRVEDTYNLLGHALRKALGVIARQQGRGLAEIAEEVGAPMLAASSLKAALDLDWDDPNERAQALVSILRTLDTIENWRTDQASATQESAVAKNLAVARQVRDQDIETAADGAPRLRRGVARNRRISVEDAEMRHGRKTRSQLIDGYKRHVLRDLDNTLIRAVGITPANIPEASVADDILADLDRQQVLVSEFHIDRAYLSSTIVQNRKPDTIIYCKAWPVRNGDHFAKTTFHLDWDAETIRCPNGVAMPFRPGGVVHFPTETCASCPSHTRCTRSTHQGRSVSIHQDEKLMAELRKRQLTPLGRAKLRERVAVEHSLAHVGRWQGRRARYRGQRKNLFDLRRVGVVHNLHAIDHRQRTRSAVAA